MGFEVTNDIFARQAWYFSNSLARANYNNLKEGIHETTQYLEVFLRNLLLDEKYPLQNLRLHISERFVKKEKQKITQLFQPKTAGHILRLFEAFEGQIIFGRANVMREHDIKLSRASELLREMAERVVIEPVSGHGKGKYTFSI